MAMAAAIAADVMSTNTPVASRIVDVRAPAAGDGKAWFQGSFG